jgi:hypothetical protein
MTRKMACPFMFMSFDEVPNNDGGLIGNLLISSRPHRYHERSKPLHLDMTTASTHVGEFCMSVIPGPPIKIPNLRNLGSTTPYWTLRVNVLENYRDQVQGKGTV